MTDIEKIARAPSEEGGKAIITDFEARAAEIAPCTCGAENLRRARNELADLPCDDDCPSRLQPAIAAALLAAFNSGVESAAVRAEDMDKIGQNWTGRGIAAAIRASIPAKDTPDE